MSKLLLRPISYRHVVFPDRTGGRSGAVNFTSLDQTSLAETSPDEHLSADEYECVRDLFHAAGLNIDDYRFETIKRRIPACLRAVRVDSLAGARAAVQRRPELLKTVVDSLVIGVTSFFRDPTVFEALGHTVIPRLLSQKKGPRIWSAGCSEGQELYSAAMLLAERGGLQRSTLLGTDCRPDALARDREGCYDHFSLRTLPNFPLSLFSKRREYLAHPPLPPRRQPVARGQCTENSGTRRLGPDPLSEHVDLPPTRLRDTVVADSGKLSHSRRVSGAGKSRTAPRNREALPRVTVHLSP